MNATPPTILTLQMYCQGLSMCMTIGCSPQIFLSHFYAVWTSTEACIISTGYLVNASPPTILPIFLYFAGVFV